MIQAHSFVLQLELLQSYHLTSSSQWDEHKKEKTKNLFINWPRRECNEQENFTFMVVPSVAANE